MSSETNALAEIAIVQGGFAFKSTDFGDEGVAVVKIANIQPPLVLLDRADRVKPEKLVGLDRFALNDGDVLMAMTGATVGKVGRFKCSEPAYLNQRVARISAKQGREFDDFIYAVLSLPGVDKLIEGSSAGSAQANISAAGIGAFPVPRLSNGEQLMIGGFSRLIDDRINLLRETNATLEAIAQAIFKSWFVDFDPVRAKMEGRAPEGMDEATAALFPDCLEESELGLVPREWRVEALGDCTAYLSRGISPKYTDKDGVLVLNQKCIRNFAIDMAKARRHDSVQRKISGRELQPGDILVNSTGVGTLGRVAQMIFVEEPTIVDSHVTVIRSNANLSWNYLGLALMRLQSKIEGLGEGTTGQTELSRGKLASIRSVYPPKVLIDAFDEIVVPLRFRIVKNQQHAQTLTSLRDTLLPRLISGKLRLSEAENTIAEAIA